MSNHAEAHHDDSHYIKVYFTLLVLLTISIIGPMFGHKLVTLVTAFGIAIVKAFLVAKNFMHINLTPRYVIYTVVTTLIFMLLFFAGTAPDVMKERGTNWEKPSWIAAQAAYEAGDLAGASHGARITGHGAGHSEGDGDGHGEGHETGHGEPGAGGHGDGQEGGGH